MKSYKPGRSLLVKDPISVKYSTKKGEYSRTLRKGETIIISKENPRSYQVVYLHEGNLTKSRMSKRKYYLDRVTSK